MDGVKIFASYAYGPTMKGYCGPPKIVKLDKKTLKKYSGKTGIAYAYKKLIAKKNKLEPFDKEVVEAYWVGNKLLNNVSTNDLKQMFYDEYTWNKPLIKKIENTPEGCKPYHNYHVIKIFSSIIGKVERTLENQKQCMILPAQVINKTTVQLMDGTKREINHIFPKVKEGDLVTVHWNTIPQKINKKQLYNLTSITGRHARLLECDWVLNML